MKRLKSQRGAALLEAAITIPLLLLVSVGIFEFGRAFQTWQIITNAAREGARLAVLPDPTPGVVETRVRFRNLSDEEIGAYLASGEWRGKAGGYAIQGLAGTFVVKLVGSYSNVVGLTLFETAALLKSLR